jgi:integrase
MKAGREHRVPLSDRAMHILAEMRSGGEPDPAGFVFAGAKTGKPLSNAATKALMKRMDVTITNHGFRSSFRDWAGERTAFAREVAEAALAHTVGDETERAYRRGDALEKRRKLMAAWSSFVTSAPAESNVVGIRSTASR